MTLNEPIKLLPGGTSGGAALAVSGSDIPLKGSKSEVAGSQNSEFLSFFAYT